jgi:hemerythrin-like domain-containing protein
MNPIEKLMAEHQNILKGLDLLERGAVRIERGGDVSPDFFRAAVDFIRNYADKYHHAKEEDILFVHMAEVGFSPEMGPVAVMLYEHNQGRGYVTGLANATEKYASGDKNAAQEIVKNALAFANLLRQHINKEDTILYPMAESALGIAGIDRMRSDFDKVEEEKAGIEDRYLKMLEALNIKEVPTNS